MPQQKTAPLTEKQKTYIRQNYRRMYISELARNLYVGKQAVTDFMRAEKLPPRIIRKSGQPAGGNRNAVAPGMFNVMERANWLI
jgi:hypothetical protein